MKWKYAVNTIPSTQQEVRQAVAESRGIQDLPAFFSPPHPRDITLEQVGIDPLAVKKAVELLKSAQQTKQKVLIFGDYDADGISASSIMWEVLNALGIVAVPFIPDRVAHGYGLSHKALDEILARETPGIVITVDNGIVAHGPIERLEQLSVPVILTDHHQPEYDERGRVILPSASTIVHTTRLCGSTVAWILARELAKELQPELEEKIVWPALDLAGVATIADQVPLRDANRSFAYWGIKELQSTQRPGLVALMNEGGIKQETAGTTEINYGLAPRINAMGRLKHGMDALRLLCTRQQSTSQRLSKVLAETNVERQSLTSDLLEEAKTEMTAWEHEHIIVVASHSFHEGVVGLIAGRLAEEFHKPAIVMSIGDTMAKASARSIAGINIVELIREVRDDLLEVGGHPMAAGFGFALDKINVVTHRLQTIAKASITKEMLQPVLPVDLELPALLFNKESVQTLSEFAPFGQGNPEPIVACKHLQVVDIFTMGNNGKHLKLVLLPMNGDEGVLRLPLQVVGWNKGHLAAQYRPGMLVDVAGVMELNVWKSKETVQLRLKDIIECEVM